MIDLHEVVIPALRVWGVAVEVQHVIRREGGCTRPGIVLALGMRGSSVAMPEVNCSGIMACCVGAQASRWRNCGWVE